MASIQCCGHLLNSKLSTKVVFQLLFLSFRKVLHRPLGEARSLKQRLFQFIIFNLLQQLVSIMKFLIVQVFVNP